MAATAISLASAFGMPTNAKDVKELVQNFDFSKMTSTSKEQKEHLKFDLAPSFGKLTSESMKLMDKNLKVMIAGTTKAIAKLENKSWDNVTHALAQNPLLEPMGKAEHRSDNYSAGGTNVFKFDGSPDADIVHKVQAWFVGLVQDDDILTGTGIDVNSLAKIVASTGATVDSFEAFFAKNEYHEAKVLEIGVLRYPDIDNPFFKVYRIELVAWSSSKRVLMVQEDTNGINGDIRIRKYKPRESTIAGMRQEVVDLAVKQAEDLFA